MDTKTPLNLVFIIDWKYEEWPDDLDRFRKLVKDYNDSSKDYNINGIELNTLGTSAGAEAVINEIIKLQPQPKLVVGPWFSSMSLQLQETLKDVPISIISPASTSTSLTNKEHFYRVIADDTSRPQGVTAYLNSITDDEAKVAVLYDKDNEEYGKILGGLIRDSKNHNLNVEVIA